MAPPTTIRKQPPKGKGSGLNKKLGPLPVWGWGVGFVLAVAVGLYLRQKSANSAAGSPTTAAAPADSGAGGVGGASSDPNTAQGIDTTGLEDAINNLGYVLGGGGGGILTQQPAGDPFFGADPFAPATAPTAPSSPSTATSAVTTGQGATGFPSGASVAGRGGGGVVPLNQFSGATRLASVAAATSVSPNIKVAAVLPQKAAPADVNPGNVASVVKLKSGATLTTLSSGRQIEQAPGKSPYVVHK